MCMRRFSSVVLILLLFAGLAWAVGPTDHGAAFPDIQLVPIDGGEPMPLSTFRGRPVLLNFWASWCGPCRMELPELQKLYNRLAGQGMVLATVNVDQNPRAAARFIESQHLAVPVYRVPPQELRSLGIRSIPTSILIDPKGRVARVFQGYGPGLEKALETMIHDMLAKKGPAESA